MTERWGPLPPDRMSGRQRELYDAITGGPRAAGPQHFALTRADGSLRGPFNAMLLEPELGEAVQNLGAAIRFAGSLSPRAREIAILIVAARWDSEFERAAHEAVGRAAGLSEQEIAALRDQDVTVFDGDEAMIAEVARQMAHGDLDDEAFDDAAARIGREQLFELSVIVGYYAMLALQLRVFRVPL